MSRKAPADLWNEDLDVFDIAYAEFEEAEAKLAKKVPPPPARAHSLRGCEATLKILQDLCCAAANQFFVE